MEPVRISLIAAVSIDGRIAAYPGHASDWTSKEDKDFLHELLDESDCVVVGRTTYELAREPLSKRNCIVFSRSTAWKEETVCFINPEKDDVFDYVRRAGYTSIAVLGGTQVYTFFLEQNLFTDLYLTIEPVVFGRGLPLFDTTVYDAKRFSLLETRKLNEQGSILLHYRACNSRMRER